MNAVELVQQAQERLRTYEDEHPALSVAAVNVVRETHNILVDLETEAIEARDWEEASRVLTEFRNERLDQARESSDTATEEAADFCHSATSKLLDHLIFADAYGRDD